MVGLIGPADAIAKDWRQRVSVRSCRGVVRPAGENGVGSRPIFWHSARSLPPAIRAITALPNSYNGYAGRSGTPGGRWLFAAMVSQYSAQIRLRNASANRRLEIKQGVVIPENIYNIF